MTLSPAAAADKAAAAYLLHGVAVAQLEMGILKIFKLEEKEDAGKSEESLLALHHLALPHHLDLRASAVTHGS